MKINHKVLLIIAIIEFFIIIVIFTPAKIQNSISSQKKVPAVMVINIDGEILSSNFYGILEKRGQNRTNATSSSDIVRMLEFFSQDDSIKAFILEIDSSGGQTAGQEEIVRYIKRIKKPVVAVIKGEALSSGYNVAAGTKRIFADNSSKIGNLGYVFAYVNRNRYGHEQECLITSSNYENITLKDCLGFELFVFDKLKHFINVSHSILISQITENRNLPYPEILTSNRNFTGTEALKFGLIDQIGTTEDALTWLETQLQQKVDIIYLREIITQKNETYKN